MSAGLPETYKNGLAVFTTPTCATCQQCKAWLRAKGIPFHEIDVAYDENAQGFLRNLNALTVPQFFLDDTYLPGGFGQLQQIAAKELGTR